MTDDEKMICKIECDASGKKKRGDSVTLTNKRLYKTGINRLGIEHRKAVSLDAVSGAEWGAERFLRVPVIGLVFFALCCVLSAYFLPHDKLLRTILGIAVLALGAVVLVTCIVITDIIAMTRAKSISSILFAFILIPLHHAAGRCGGRNHILWSVSVRSHMVIV